MIRPRGKEEGGWLGLHKQHGKRGRRAGPPHTEKPADSHSASQRRPLAAGHLHGPSRDPAGGRWGCPRPVRLRTEGRGLACPSPTPRHRADAHPSGWAHVWEHARALPLSVYTPPGSQHFIPHSRGDDSGDRETFKCGNASARTQPEKAKSNPKKERPRFSVIVTVILDEATFPRAV